VSDPVAKKAMKQLAKLTFVVLFCGLTAVAATSDIKVDQVGYLPDAPKIAFVVADGKPTQFLVRRKQDNSVVFRGKLSMLCLTLTQAIKYKPQISLSSKRPVSFILKLKGLGRVGILQSQKMYIAALTIFQCERSMASAVEPLSIWDVSIAAHPPVTARW
jgi:hypothetical protein